MANRPLEPGDLVQCHLFGSFAPDTPDLQTGYVRHRRGVDKAGIYWFQQRKEFVATIAHQSGELFITSAGNVFVRIGRMEKEQEIEHG